MASFYTAGICDLIRVSNDRSDDGKNIIHYAIKNCGANKFTLATLCLVKNNLLFEKTRKKKTPIKFAKSKKLIEFVKNLEKTESRLYDELNLGNLLPLVNYKRKVLLLNTANVERFRIVWLC